MRKQRPPHSLETREKIRQSTIGKRLGFKHTEETKLKMSLARLKNPNNYWLGKKRSTSDRLKMSVPRLRYNQPELFICLNCKKEFKQYKSNNTSSTPCCSRSCASIQRHILNPTFKYHLKGTKQSPEIIEKRASQCRGENHWRYIKDRTKLQSRTRTALIEPEYSKWRMSVFNRDNFKCKLTNKDCKGKIEAHHILTWKKYPELRLEINNGITLCHYHHPRKNEKVKELETCFIELIKNYTPCLS